MKFEDPAETAGKTAPAGSNSGGSGIVAGGGFGAGVAHGIGGTVVMGGENLQGEGGKGVGDDRFKKGQIVWVRGGETEGR